MRDPQSRGHDTDSPVDVDPQHLAGVAIGAVVVALYASWMAADLVARWLTIPVVVVIAGGLLYGRTSASDKLAVVGYMLAALLALTPVLIILPDVLGDFTERPVEMAFTVSNVLLVVFFALLAALVAYLAYRVDGGRGIIQRVRTAR